MPLVSRAPKLSLWLYLLGAKVYGVGNNPNMNKKLFYELGLKKKIKLSLFDIRDYKKVDSLIKKLNRV